MFFGDRAKTATQNGEKDEFKFCKQYVSVTSPWSHLGHLKVHEPTECSCTENQRLTISTCPWSQLGQTPTIRLAVRYGFSVNQFQPLGVIYFQRIVVAD